MLEDHRRSNLTFVADQGSNELIRFDRLQRVREPVGRSKSGVQGKVADVLHGRSRHAESQNELKAFQIVMATALADSWQEQPFILEYRHEDARRRYTPDILVIWGSHREVVEVKEDKEAELPENQSRFSLIKELLAEHGYHFRLWKKSEIYAEPRLTNCNLILRYRCVTVPAQERERLRRALASKPESDLRTLCETSATAVQTVLRLVLDGMLSIDWWKPLGLDSKVGVAPIGRQEWPCPPRVLQLPSGEARCP
jgi:hypothetical protein